MTAPVFMFLTFAHHIQLVLKIEKYNLLVFLFIFGLGLACLPEGQCCHPKKSTLAKIFTKKCEVHLPLRFKKRPVKITMYLGLDIIIKLQFTPHFDYYCRKNSENWDT